MIEKKWQFAKEASQDFKNQFPEINPLILQLLANRGITTQQQIDKFLNPDYSKDLHDPFLFNNMKKAVDRILKAIENKEKIVVYGDYDADGVSASVIMVSLLEALGSKADVYIPFRETEGYGLNLEAVKELAQKGVELLITVDCGISNVKEIESLKKDKVDVIITDHHQQLLELPVAYAILNPNVNKEKYPFKNLAGCGVAFKLVQAVLAKHQNYKVNQLPAGWKKWLLDLVAIGTIADLMPILGENRTLVKYGITVLQKTRRQGLIKLIEIAGNQLADSDEQTVGWRIAPRINAAGRLNHASSAYQLLITQDEKEAKHLAEELNATNQERQRITEEITEEARKTIGEPRERKLLSVVGKGWPTGVVGLVSGRLTDQFHRPTLVISRFNDQIIGSGRSITGFDIAESLQECNEFLARFGGHSQACGFTIKDESSVEKFINKMNQLAEQKLTAKDLLPTIDIDAEVNLEEIDWELFGKLEKFAPFGQGNPKPKFLAQDLTVTELQTVGQDGKHLRLMVNHNTPVVRKTIGFCFGDWCTKIKRGDKIDMVFEIDVNEWNGNRELQLKIVDLKI